MGPQPPFRSATQDDRPLCEVAGVVNKELEEALAVFGNLESRLFGPRPAVGMTAEPSDGSVRACLSDAAAKANRLSTWARDLLRAVEVNQNHMAASEPQKRYG